MKQHLRQIVLPVGLTLLAGIASYLVDLNIYIAGADERLIQIAQGVWMILTVAAIVAAVPGLRAIAQPWLLGIILAGSFIVCNMFYLALSFGSDSFIGSRKLHQVNAHVRALALDSAGMTIFLVLCIASLIALLSRRWPSLSPARLIAKRR